jgi:prolyl 4-hydroxylase
MHKSWQSELEVFTPAECQSLVSEFFSYDHTDENKMPEYYRNSFGYYNLPGSLTYVDRVSQLIKDRYPKAVFSNTYTRVYNRHSVLNLHTDRKGLDITLSVCLEDKNNLDWPLNISAKTYSGEEWDLKQDPSHYKEQYLETHFGVGFGAVMEGRRFPHWRDELLCGEKQRAVYIFYHWSLPKIKEPSRVIFSSTSPLETTLYKEFLTKEQCHELITAAEPALIKSTVVDQKTGGSVDHPNRSSYGTFLKRGSTPLIKSIEERIAQITGIPVEHGEDLQILRYEPNQEYKPHHDYFSLKDNPTAQSLETAGQRIMTFLIYLNTPEEGGGTYFPEANLQFEAEEGYGLLFKYEKQERQSLHAGTPVKKGVKWVATKWLREKAFK